jgi:hypothetical protein
MPCCRVLYPFQWRLDRAGSSWRRHCGTQNTQAHFARRRRTQKDAPMKRLVSSGRGQAPTSLAPSGVLVGDGCIVSAGARTDGPHGEWTFANNGTTIDLPPVASGSGKFARGRLTHLCELRAQDHLIRVGPAQSEEEGAVRRLDRLTLQRPSGARPIPDKGRGALGLDETRVMAGAPTSAFRATPRRFAACDTRRAPVAGPSPRGRSATRGGPAAAHSTD